MKDIKYESDIYMVRRLSEEDWAEIEAAYCANKISVRELARRHDLSDTAIRKHAKEEHWPRRDHKALAVIDARSRVRVIHELKPPPIITQGSRGKSLERTRRTLELLQAELDAEGVNVGWLEEAIYDYTENDKSPRRYQAMMKAVSLPVRILAAKNLALAMKTLKDSSPGKKQQAQDDADTAGKGTEWGDDLNFGGARTN